MHELLFFSYILSSSDLVLIILRTHHGDRTTELDFESSYPQQKWALRNVRQHPTFILCLRLTTLDDRTQKNPDDVVITLAIRTPLTKGFKGGMKDTPLDYMVHTLLKQVLEKSNIDPQMVEDVCLGNVSSTHSLLSDPADLGKGQQR